MEQDNKPHFDIIAPIFPVMNIKASLEYYTEKLLFITSFEWSEEDANTNYAILSQGDAELHLSVSEKPHKTAAYIFVDGIEEYFDMVSKTGASITSTIEEQPWEMKEFEATDLDGNVLIFGEHLDLPEENAS